MLNFILKRIFYGFLVILGVVVLVFVLFNILPGDPAQMMLGQRSDQESIDMINKDLGLDKPLSTQFLYYINDLSPLSIHSKNSENGFYLDNEKYNYLKLFVIGESVIVIKKPYLRRSYQSKKKVS